MADSQEAETRKLPPPSPDSNTERLGHKSEEGMLDGELPVGGILADRYQVIERLSAGGMGVVYKAKHLALDDIVAVKLLLRPQDETDRKRFLLEARLATKIKHPNTVYVSDFGILPDGRSFLVMEFMRGQMLSSALNAGKLEVLRACRIAVQIARGLQAVHDQSIVHRDLKPDNIFLLQQDGQTDFVKIVDFGIAKANNIPASVALELPPPPDSGEGETAGGETARLTGALKELEATTGNMTVKSAILGTPRYMSPEAIKGKAVDGRADQYSLGCVLFQLLTGHLPFLEDDLMGLLTQHMYEPVPELRKEVPEVPEAIAEIVKKLLAKKPEDRYESMRTLEQALEREIELIMVQRGERAVISSALAGLLKVQGKGLGAVVMIAGRAVPLWVLAPVALLLVVGGAGLGVHFLAPKVIKEVLRPGEMRELRKQALAVLRADLKTGSDPLKLGALSAFGQSHDRELRADLEAQLGSASALLRAQAAEGLGQLGERQVIPLLTKLLEKEKEPMVRLGAASALHQLGDPHAATELDSLLGSTSAEAQLRAALARCDRLPDKARSVLNVFLGRPELPSGPRLSILACLARVGDAQAVAALRTQAQTGVRPAERITAQVRLAELGDFPSREALQKLIRERGSDHLLAARLLAGPDELGGREAFRSVLHDNGAHSGARRLGAEGLGSIGELFDARLLGAQIATQGLTPELRQIFAAAILLISVHDPGLMSDDSLSWATAALGDASWLERQAAVTVLGDIKDSQARKLLTRAMKDQDRRVRAAAARALGRQIDREALTLLRGGLDDPAVLVRVETLRALSRVSRALYRGGAADLLPMLQGFTQAVMGRGTDPEKILALGLFLNLGDKGRLPELMKFVSAVDPATRLLLVEQLENHKDPLSRLLADADATVRTLAAVRLGTLGDTRAVPVLKEALGRGGTGALTALGILHFMNERKTTPQELLTLYATAHDEERLTAVKRSVDLPPELALALLLRSARDIEAEIRQQTAESAAELPMRDERQLGWAVLQILVTDREVAVRMRALALLAGLQSRAAVVHSAKNIPRGSGRPEDAQGGRPNDGGTARGDLGGSEEAQDLGTPSDQLASYDLASTLDLAMPEATPTEAPEEQGTLQLQGPEFMQAQIDDQKWQYVSAKPITLSVGEHKVQTMLGAKTVEIKKDKETTLEVKPSPIELGAQEGVELFKSKQYDKALRLLERAYSGCEKARGKQQKACRPLMAEISYYKANIFEEQDRVDAAATEYQRVVDSETHGGQAESYRSTSKKSLDKLAARLGLIVFKQSTKKGCQEEKLWVQPGNPVVKLGGEERSVRIRARQTVNLGECE